MEKKPSASVPAEEKKEAIFHKQFKVERTTRKNKKVSKAKENSSVKLGTT